MGLLKVRFRGDSEIVEFDVSADEADRLRAATEAAHIRHHTVVDNDGGTFQLDTSDLLWSHYQERKADR